MLSLYNLKNFVKVVDKFEIHIYYTVRLEYRNKYVPQIEELMAVLDEERITLILKEE